MKRYLFIMILTFCCGLGAAWYWTINDFIKFSGPNYPIWLAKKQMIDHCDVGVLAIIGDSRAETSLYPKIVGTGVVNLSLSASSVMSMYEESRQIVACPHPPKAIILTLDPRRFYDDKEFWENDVKYALFGLPLDELRRQARAMKDDTLYDKPVPFDLEARLKNSLYLKKFPAYYFSSLLAGALFMRADVNQHYYEDTLEDRGYHIFGEDIGNDNIEDFALHPNFITSVFLNVYFKKLLDLYAEHHIPVYFIGHPMKAISVNAAGPMFQDAYSDYLKQWESSNQNFHILGEIMPVLDPKYFGDSSHLNALGAALWSHYVSQLLDDAHVQTHAEIFE